MTLVNLFSRVVILIADLTGVCIQRVFVNVIWICVSKSVGESCCKLTPWRQTLVCPWI